MREPAKVGGTNISLGVIVTKRTRPNIEFYATGTDADGYYVWCTDGRQTWYDQLVEKSRTGNRPHATVLGAGVRGGYLMGKLEGATDLATHLTPRDH